MQRYGQNDDLGLLRGIDPSPVYLINNIPHRTIRVQIQFGWPASPKSYWFIAFVKKGENGWEKLNILEETKMRSIIFDENSGRERICSCGCCGDGSPVNLPEMGQRLYSTGSVTPKGGNYSACTLFMTADRSRAVYVPGTHSPYIPSVSCAPRRLFQKSGFTHLAMCSAGNVFYDRDEIEEVAEHLSYFGSRSKVKTRLESFGFPADYVEKLVALIPDGNYSDDEVFDKMHSYHCGGDVFMMGSSEMGEVPSFLFGWTYGDPNKDHRSDSEKEWDEIIGKIDTNELPEPEFTGLSDTHPCMEIQWQDKVWKKDFEACQGKYNWVSTGGKWKPTSQWYEVEPEEHSNRVSSYEI